MPKQKAVKYKLDVMSITVLLVMAIFGGLVGFYIGQSTATNQTLMLKEVAGMMQQEGMKLDSTGKMMVERGMRYGDKDLKDWGKMMSDDGVMMQGKGSTMMTGY